jgi:protein-disulfide isomerase
MDTDQFNQCLTSAQFRPDVEKDYLDGQKAGVSGTPGFFINGRFLNGAQPFEAFQKIIDEELERIGAS